MLDLGELRIGEVDLLLESLQTSSPESMKNVLHGKLIKKLKSLKAFWEKTETMRKNKRQNVLKSRSQKSKIPNR